MIPPPPPGIRYNMRQFARFWGDYFPTFISGRRGRRGRRNRHYSPRKLRLCYKCRILACCIDLHQLGLRPCPACWRRTDTIVVSSSRTDLCLCDCQRHIEAEDDQSSEDESAGDECPPFLEREVSSDSKDETRDRDRGNDEFCGRDEISNLPRRKETPEEDAREFVVAKDKIQLARLERSECLEQSHARQYRDKYYLLARRHGIDTPVDQSSRKYYAECIAHQLVARRIDPDIPEEMSDENVNNEITSSEVASLSRPITIDEILGFIIASTNDEDMTVRILQQKSPEVYYEISPGQQRIPPAPRLCRVCNSPFTPLIERGLRREVIEFCPGCHMPFRPAFQALDPDADSEELVWPPFMNHCRCECGCEHRLPDDYATQSLRSTPEQTPRNSPRMTVIQRLQALGEEVPDVTHDPPDTFMFW